MNAASRGPEDEAPPSPQPTPSQPPPPPPSQDGRRGTADEPGGPDGSRFRAGAGERGARDRNQGGDAGIGPDPAAGSEGPFDRLKRSLGALWERAETAAEPSSILSYREVVGYLAANQPGPEAVRGALLRRRTAGRWVFRMFYLDAADQPVLDPRRGRRIGRNVVASDCDEELAELFGRADLIVFD